VDKNTKDEEGSPVTMDQNFIWVHNIVVVRLTAIQGDGQGAHSGQDAVVTARKTHCRVSGKIK